MLLDVYGRPVILYDVDPATREFYMDVLGYSAKDMEPITLESLGAREESGAMDGAVGYRYIYEWWSCCGSWSGRRTSRGGQQPISF